MYETNALTDTIGMVIAVSFALQTAMGPGLSALANLASAYVPVGLSRWVAIAAGGTLGGLLGVIAWRSDGDDRWIVIGALAGLLAGASQRGPAQGRPTRSIEASDRCDRNCCRGERIDRTDTFRV